MKWIYTYLLCLLLGANIQAQQFSLGVGTDIPYQHYIGLNVETKWIDVSYRTGLLAPPYSDAILALIGALGVEPIYTNLIDAAFEVGWMNSLGAYYKFGKNKRWHGGVEFRVDYLTAADTPIDLLEVVLNRSLRAGRPNGAEIEAKLGLTLFAVGIRLGYTFPIGTTGKHHIRTEFSFSKHIATQSSLMINDVAIDNLNPIINDLMWNDVFKDYGFLGGIGVAYIYRF